MTHYADYKVLQYTSPKDTYPKGYCGAEKFIIDSDFDIPYSKDGEMYKMKRDPNNPIEPSPFVYYGKRWLASEMMILVCGTFAYYRNLSC